jgi:hypothetical protein
MDSSPTDKGTPNQALEQTRDSVLRCREPVGRELLNLVVRGIKDTLDGAARTE